MADLSERLHVLLSAEQSEELKRLAAASGKAVGQLVREALEHTYGGSEPVEALLALRSMAQTGYIMEETWQDVRERLER